QGKATAQTGKQRCDRRKRTTGTRSGTHLDVAFVARHIRTERIRLDTAPRVRAVESGGARLYGGGRPFRLETASRSGTVGDWTKPVRERTRRIHRCRDSHS